MAPAKRIGLIGAGRHGRYLSQVLRELDEVELVAAANRGEEARLRAQQECGFARVYADYRTMLGEEQLDAVLVATSHDFLAKACLAALAQGCHVFCEKPLALNAGQARTVAAAAREARRVLMVGYCLRYNQARLALKRLADQGSLGEIRAFVGGKGAGPWSGWLARRESGGGPMMLLGSHLIDQVLWLTGRAAEQVYASMTWQRDGGLEETATINLHLAGDVNGELLVTQGTGVAYDYVELFGSSGRARVEWPSMLLSVQSAVDSAYAYPTTIRVSGDSQQPMYVAELTEFLSAVREGRQATIGGGDAASTLAVIDAAFASANSGRPVSLAGP